MKFKYSRTPNTFFRTTSNERANEMLFSLSRSSHVTHSSVNIYLAISNLQALRKRRQKDFLILFWIFLVVATTQRACCGVHEYLLACHPASTSSDRQAREIAEGFFPWFPPEKKIMSTSSAEKKFHYKCRTAKKNLSLSHKTPTQRTCTRRRETCKGITMLSSLSLSSRSNKIEIAWIEKSLGKSTRS